MLSSIICVKLLSETFCMISQIAYIIKIKHILTNNFGCKPYFNDLKLLLKKNGIEINLGKIGEL